MSKLNKALIIASSLFLLGCTFDGTGLTGTTSTTGETTEDSVSSSTETPRDLGNDSDPTTSEPTTGEIESTSIGTTDSIDTSSSGTSSTSSTTQMVETTGPQPYCGDGIVDENEECDDFGKDTTYCRKDCKISTCGDGYANLNGLEECDDGNEDDNDLCNNNCIFNRKCWVSESSLPGNMGGLEIADSLCEGEALFYGIPGPVKALMGDSIKSPKIRLGSENFQGNYICEFKDKFELLHKGWFEYSVKNPLVCMANKERIPNKETFVWTFFENFGELGEGSAHCGDWKEAGERDTGMFGNPNSLGYWREFSEEICLAENRIYCCQSEAL